MLRWIEHVVIDVLRDRTDSIDTSDALHKPGRIPRRIVVDNDIGAMQVNTFSKNIRGEDDVYRIELDFGVSIKILLNKFHHLVSILGSNQRNVRSPRFVLHALIQIFECVNAFREDNELPFFIDIRAHELICEHLFELVEFLVVVLLVPVINQIFKNFLIILEKLQQFRIKILRREGNLIGKISLAHSVLNDLIQFHPLCLKVFNLQIRGNQHTSIFEHADHIVSNTEKGTQRFLERMETAFKSLHHMNFVNPGQRLSKVDGILIFAL